MQEIILASSSTSRRKELGRLNIEFSVIPPQVDEDSIKHTETDHLQISRKLALLKARNVSLLHPEAIVIGGDTVASFNRKLLSKPITMEKSFEQLRMLAGQEHSLFTSLVIITKGEEYIHSVTAIMKMRDLSDEQIYRYIEIDAPLHSCGSYRLDALGISLFESIDCEDYTAIIGIPLIWTAGILNQIGVSVP